MNPGETGKIQIALQTTECVLYGPIDATIYVIVNGKRNLTADYAITLKADLKEDFSALTVEERQQAPILEVADKIQLGTVKVGKKLTSKITLSNVGVNPMLVRRVISNDSHLTVIAPKSAIKGGKKADLKLELNAQELSAGNYSRVITLITNDPAHAVVRLYIDWVVE